MKEKLLNILPGMLSFLYKNKCVCCKNQAANTICSSCMKQITTVSGSPVRIIENVKIYSACKYQGNIKEALHALKFSNKRNTASDLGLMLYKYWLKTDLSNQRFQIVPIPIHKSKRKIRGYDQTELITATFCFLSGNKHNTRLLSRVKNTWPQFRLTQQERSANLKDAFKVNKKFLKKMPVLIVDDICTTGTTIKEAIKALNNENILDITVLTLSHVDLRIQQRPPESF